MPGRIGHPENQARTWEFGGCGCSIAEGLREETGQPFVLNALGLLLEQWGMLRRLRGQGLRRGVARSPCKVGRFLFLLLRASVAVGQAGRGRKEVPASLLRNDDRRTEAESRLLCQLHPLPRRGRGSGPASVATGQRRARHRLEGAQGSRVLQRRRRSPSDLSLRKQVCVVYPTETLWWAQKSI